MGDSIFEREGLVKQGDLVFDIGCKVGKMTDLFLAAGARVVCVEPYPPNANFMREKYGNAIIVVEAAVTDKPGKDTLFYTTRGKMNPSLVPAVFARQFRKAKAPHNRKMTVRTMTIDELTAGYGKPSFVKLDVEGSEFKALLGMMKPVPALCFEFGMGYISEAWKCVTLLAAKGYEFNYVEGHHGEFELDGWRDLRDFQFELPKRNNAGKYNWGNVFARLIDATS